MTSINFLNKVSNIDWNKYLREAIPYVSKESINEILRYKDEILIEKTTNESVKMDQYFTEEEENQKNKYIELIKEQIIKSNNQSKEYKITNIDLKQSILKYLFE